MGLPEKGIVVSSYTNFIYTNRSELLLNFDLSDGHTLRHIITNEVYIYQT